MNKTLKTLSVAGIMLVSGILLAEDANSLRSIADNVRGNLGAVVDLIIGLAFLAGVAFFLTGLVKFKAHKDNPTQVPLSAPLVLISISACLMFLPSLIDVAGETVFAGSQESASGAVKGEGSETDVFLSQ